jgi:hypothetical protein
MVPINTIPKLVIPILILLLFMVPINPIPIFILLLVVLIAIIIGSIFGHDGYE